MPARLPRIGIAACLALGLGGCARQRDLTITRCWADWNTLGAHAVFCEKLSHQPPAAVRVDAYRWMYGEGPGMVVPAGEFASAMPAEAFSESACPPATPAPLAPPADYDVPPAPLAPLSAPE